MFRGIWHTKWEPTHEILRSNIEVEKDAQYGLAAGHREGGKTLGGMANQGDVEGGHLVLIWSVLSTMPMFCSSVFKMPIEWGSAWKAR